ncbi:MULTISPECIES: hypothetical protein [Lysinibacillus]|uniref:hypothetical protein n=1 Tax=Lysinibacillus TaxID=400634 RepID=UPI0021524335|nr:hypothetical protein [Lysinibacillus capsici]MCR6522148.1 hypothetical protein [Lysinibacillus capsici]
MVFSMFLNTYSTETINKIQSSIIEHSTVQEIQKNYRKSKSDYLPYDLGILRNGSYIRFGKSRQSKPIQETKISKNTIVEVIERKK